MLSPFPTLQRPACLAGKSERPGFAVLYTHRPHHRQHRFPARLAGKDVLGKSRNHRHQRLPTGNLVLIVYQHVLVKRKAKSRQVTRKPGHGVGIKHEQGVSAGGKISRQRLQFFRRQLLLGTADDDQVSVRRHRVCLQQGERTHSVVLSLQHFPQDSVAGPVFHINRIILSVADEEIDSFLRLADAQERVEHPLFVYQGQG